MAGSGGVVLVVIFDIPPRVYPAFDAYESRVLPLVAEHGGRVERRLTSEHRTNEVHVVWFPDRASLVRFRADPRRTSAGPDPDDLGVVTEVREFAV